MSEIDASMVEPVAPPLRVLLVEDDEFDVAVFGRAFRRTQIACEIVRCRRGEEVLEGLRDAELELDLLITDHQLPGQSGFDLCLELIERYRSGVSDGTGPPFALVLLTGVGSEQMAIRALRAGINDYIVKDTSREYLELLPLVLPRVARRHRQRRHRRLAAQQQGRTSSETERSAGSRIGLSACAEAIEHRGGRVWVENNSGQAPALCFRVPLAPDEVTFWTPAREAPDRDPVPAPVPTVGDGMSSDLNAEVGSKTSAPASESADRDSLHVLIVHPNPIVTFVTRRTIERMGHRCAAIESGLKALEALDREPFDLVLLALDMPRLDGLETARRIRRNEGGHEGSSCGSVPILGLATAVGAEGRCREAGMNGVVEAPISAHPLKLAIERSRGRSSTSEG